MQSWQKFCPDYLIVEWNEKNFNIKECPQYVIDAYHRKKWAFVTDYVRLRVVYEYGGIYFDTDVELVKKIDFLLKYSAFFGFENKKYISTGLGFGAERGCGLLYEMMEMYQTIPFILEDGSENKKTCPVINTEIFLKHGLEQKDKQQILEGNIMILPSICMCPIDFETGYRRKSKKTISVHWFHASWMERAEKEYHKKHRQALLEEKSAPRCRPPPASRRYPAAGTIAARPGSPARRRGHMYCRSPAAGQGQRVRPRRKPARH